MFICSYTPSCSRAVVPSSNEPEAPNSIQASPIMYVVKGNNLHSHNQGPKSCHWEGFQSDEGVEL